MVRFPSPPAQYSALLERRDVPAHLRPQYLKWLRFYLDFCQRHGHPADNPGSLDPYLTKLAQKGQETVQREEARCAVGLYLQLQAETKDEHLSAYSKSTSKTAPPHHINAESTVWPRSRRAVLAPCLPATQ